MQWTTLNMVRTQLLFRWAERVFLSRYIRRRRRKLSSARMKEPTAMVPKWYCITRPYERQIGNVSFSLSSPLDQYQRQKAPAIVVKEMALISPIVQNTMKMLYNWKTGCRSTASKALVSTIVPLLNTETLVRFCSSFKAACV